MSRSSLVSAIIVLAILVTSGVWFFGDKEVTSQGNKEEVRLRFEISSVNLDPRTVVDIESKKVATLLHAGLVAVNLDGVVEPRLAQSWERVDATTWRFKLREDVRFSDGSPVNASVVVASLCEAIQPTSFWAWSLSSISRSPSVGGEKVECIGLLDSSEFVVDVTEEKATDWLLEALAGPGGWIIKAGTDAAEYGVRPGIGPYVVGSIDPGVRVTLVAREDGTGVLQPNLSKVVFRHIQDPSVAVQAFLRGELDILRIDTPQLYDALVQTVDGNRSLKTNGRLLAHYFGRTRVIIVNEPALAKKGADADAIAKIKLALKNAIDRERIADLAPGNALPVDSAFPFGEPEEPFEVREAIVDPSELDAITLSLLVNNDPYSDYIAAALPKEIGNIRIGYRAVDFGIIISALQSHDHELVGLSLDATIDSPIFYESFFRPGAALTLFGKPIEDLRDVDTTTQSGLQEAKEIIDRQGNWIPLYREEGLLALSSRIDGLRLTKSGQESLELLSVKE